MTTKENLLPYYFVALFSLISNEEFAFMTALVHALIQTYLDLRHVESVLIASDHYSSLIDGFATIYEPAMIDRSTAAEILK